MGKEDGYLDYPSIASRKAATIFKPVEDKFSTSEGRVDAERLPRLLPLFHKELRSPTLPACLFDQTHPSFGPSAPNQRSVITFFRV